MQSVMLVVPGRKTDVKDSEWICQLVQHGLVRPSFVPPPEIRRLRDLTRLRAAQNNERTRTIQRLEKVLQDAGIKISSVASTSYSKSARAMLEALLSGVSDPDQLAELSKGRMRAKIPQLREALQNRFTIEHHGVMLAQLLAHIDTLDTELQHLSERIELVLAPHAHIIELLSTIPGVQAHAAQVVIAECGLDMSVFPTVGHFASWAGACPGHHQSAGRRKSGRTRPGPKWLTSQLTECARAAVRTKETYLASHFAQLRGRRGEPKAIGAIRHDLLVAYYPIVRDQVPYRDLGPNWQRKRYSVEHRAGRLLLTDSRDGDDGAIEDGDEGAERLNVERVWGTNDRTTKAQTCVRIPASSVPIPPAIRGRRATPSRRHPAPPQAR